MSVHLVFKIPDNKIMLDYETLNHKHIHYQTNLSLETNIKERVFRQHRFGFRKALPAGQTENGKAPTAM